jgi:hypothetical protein
MSSAATAMPTPVTPPDTGYVWFRSRDDVQPYLNETAVRIRAGIMLVVPIFMAFTLVDIVWHALECHGPGHHRHL